MKPSRNRWARARSAGQMRYFMLTTALAFVLVLAFLVLTVERVSTDALVRAEEHANINLGLVIANAAVERFRDLDAVGGIFSMLSVRSAGSPRSGPHFSELDRVIRGYARGTAIFKVKIYGATGEVLYSTDLSQVGVVNPLNEAVAAALSGTVVSQLLHRDSFSAFDREMTDVDLVQSYIPGSLIGFGTDQLVFEVYADVTGELVDLRADQRRLFTTLGLAMLLLYIALHLLVWSTQSLLRQKSIERDRAYQRMAEAELELARRKASFVAAAAHELRTPMTTIRGFSELLRDRPMEPPQLRDMADAINQQAEGMSQLLDELLDLSQFDEQGKAAMLFSLQPLAPLVRAVVDSASAQGMSGHDIQLEVAPHLPDVMIDARRIKQVVVNLLSNACKFSDAGAPIRVLLLLDSPPGQGQRVGLRVEDRGCGILPEEMPHLFERFWRSPRVSKIKGTGLGMPIVKGLVELHDGSIDVTSRSGGGTVVTAWLPCRQAHPGSRECDGGGGKA